jgi:alanine dehydrogenase
MLTARECFSRKPIIMTRIGVPTPNLSTAEHNPHSPLETPHLDRLAAEGVEGAARADRGFAGGINVIRGQVTNAGVAEAHGLSHTPLREVARLEP